VAAQQVDCGGIDMDTNADKKIWITLASRTSEK